MSSLRSLTPASVRGPLRVAVQALRAWTPRQHVAAAVFALALALLVGIPTVLIPNPVFSRQIPVLAWNYPVWVLTSVLAGMLAATYVRPSAVRSSGRADVKDATGNLDGATTSGTTGPDGAGDRPGTFGMVGGVLAWFAVGCPVCNKLALLALGYSGAITWFAPFQPVLAVLALVTTGGALVVRLNGQVSCALPSPLAAARA